MKNKKKIVILSVLLVILCIGLGTLFFLVNRNGFVVENKEKNQIVYYQKGKKIYGKQKIKDYTYYFDEKTGYLYKGFFNKNNITYYADEKGRMAKGLTKIKNDNYYFDDDFVMLKERFIDIEKDNKRQTSYFNQDGKMVYGFIKIKNDGYYFNGDGALIKDKKIDVQIKGKKQTSYFDKNGKMYYGIKKEDKDYFYYDKNGALVKNDFVNISINNKKQTSYFNQNGKMVYGLQNVDQCTYYFDTDGAMIKNQFQDYKINGKQMLSYFNSNGVRVYGIQTIGNHQYYFGEDGNLVKDTSLILTIDGINRKCHFDKNGVMSIEPIPKKPFRVSELKSGVQQIINKYGGNISVYFKDLTSGNGFSLNDVTMYPCCMIKVATLGTFMQEVEKGNIDYNAYANYVYPMITVSDNTSYNKIMKGLGKGNGQKGAELVCKFASSIGMHRTGVYHGLRPGNDYFPGITSNISCASDIGIFFEKLYYGQIVNQQRSQQMLNIFLQCIDDDGIMSGLPAGTAYANKTGCAYDLNHDGGIVFAPNRPYVLVIFSDRVNYTSMMKEVSSYIYNYEVNAK